MKEKLFLLCIFLTSVSAYADIATNPIKAKSISTPIPTSVRMVKEKVIVDLHKDSSVVKCTYYMKNLGDDETKIFLQNSYSFYADCFPDSATMIVDKFISFCDREIDLTENEQTEIKKALSVINPKDTSAFSIDKYYPWGIDNNYDRLVKGQPYISKLACILTEEKVELLTIKIKEHLNQVIKSKSQLYKH